MKVTKIETLRASRFIYVRVHTDEGIAGIGELHPASGTSGTPFAPIAAVDYCAEYLIGKDPLHIERNWQHMFRRCVFRGGADTMAAIGAIDIALWDIKGKVAELPVHSLLGGPTRERVYSHLQGDSPAELAEDARRMVEAGYTALRLYPFGAFVAGEGTSLEQLSFRGMAKHAAATLQAVRDAVGDEIDLMVDVVNRLTPPEAIEVAKALEPYGLFFFEDPIEPENMDAWGHVAANMPVPVAMGRAALHHLPVPRAAGPQGGLVHPAGPVARRWNHELQKDRGAGRSKLRGSRPAQPAELRPDRGVRATRRRHPQRRHPRVPSGRGRRP